jgi:glucoamylase
MFGRHAHTARTARTAVIAVTTIATATTLTTSLTGSAGAAGTAAARPEPAATTGTAFGAPGRDADYLPADKSGFGTSYSTGSRASRASNVWYTLERGELSEVYYPDLSTPATRDLQLIVTDGRTFTERERYATTHVTRLVDPRALVYRQVDTERQGRWRVVKTYVTDPSRATVLVDVSFRSLTGQPYQVYASFDPDLGNDGNDDSARTVGTALAAWDASSASALVARPAFRALANGYLGTSDGWTDLRTDHRLDWRFGLAPDGNVVQTGRTALDGVTHQHLTLALGFAPDRNTAVLTANASLATGFQAAAAAYALGWHHYLAGLRHPPASLRSTRERRLYDASLMVLAASEDKLHRGAFVASPTMPWAWGYNDELASPTGPYHLVWPRDLYQMATALLAAGDRAAARRALDYMWDVQQQPDGHLAQNTRVDGTPYWTNIQLDETADPIVLSWQLHRTDAATWRHVRRAVHFIVNYSLDGYPAPYTQQERWENQSGYSPATIAAEIAALVCAAKIAKANGANVRAHFYLGTADRWQASVNRWTATTNGPYSPKPYYLRLTKDGHPNAGTTYALGDSSFSAIDQRAVVDPSFLDLVRLGVKSAHDPVIENTVAVVDAHLAVHTANGTFWHRYTGDGYGERRDGRPWDIGFPDDGEYELLAGGAPSYRLASIARAANNGYLLPEQVWDHNQPGGTNGFVPGEPTFSATPLGWTHAQFVRLAWSIVAGHPVEAPRVVACRYAVHC